MELEFDDCVLYQEVLATKASTRSSPNWATFRLRLFREPGWQSVAIATQMPFEGISLTNAAEGIAASIWQEFLAEDDEPPISHLAHGKCDSVDAGALSGWRRAIHVNPG